LPLVLTNTVIPYSNMDYTKAGDEFSQDEQSAMETLTNLFQAEDWKENSNHLARALSILKDHPKLAKYPFGEPSTVPPLYYFLRCNKIPLEAIQWMYPRSPVPFLEEIQCDVGVDVEFVYPLDEACKARGATPAIMSFLLDQKSKKGPHGISLNSDLLFETYATRILQHRVDTPNYRQDDWDGILQVCELLWKEGAGSELEKKFRQKNKERLLKWSVEIGGCRPMIRYLLKKGPRTLHFFCFGAHEPGVRPPFVLRMAQDLDLILSYVKGTFALIVPYSVLEIDAFRHMAVSLKGNSSIYHLRLTLPSPSNFSRYESFEIQEALSFLIQNNESRSCPT